LRYGVGDRGFLIPIRGFFERRGREGFAEYAEKKIPKKYKNLKKKTKRRRKKNCFYELHIKSFKFSEFFVFIFVFSFDSFCALCETFAPSAFKKSPVPPPSPF
jgi:hypothetical protein